MGTIGRGCWRRNKTKTLCEEVFRLDANAMAEDGILFPNARGTIKWQNSSFAATGLAVRFEVIGANISGAQFLRISFCWNGIDSTQEIPLTATRPHFGGRRIWFRCPAGTNSEKPCGRRCAMLYLLNGRFACRACHSLV